MLKGGVTMEHLCFVLSLLVYFPTKVKQCSALSMVKNAFYDEDNLRTRWNERNFIPNLNLLQSVPYELLEGVELVDVVDDNANSGVVYYIFTYKGAYYYVFRGSEAKDDLYHTTCWQDWEDNLKLFINEITPQQQYAIDSIQQHLHQGSFYMCGHSKGGQLALLCAMSLSATQREALKGVVSFNAPGFQKIIIDEYASTLSYEELLKFHLFESEHDCVSSCFEHIKNPYYIQSPNPCRTVLDLYHHHNVYGLECMLYSDYLLCEEKSIVPQMIHYLVNERYLQKSEEQRREFVTWMNEAFTQELTAQELIAKALKRFLRIPQAKAMNAMQDLSQLSWLQLLRKVQEFKKNMDINDIETLENDNNISQNMQNEIDIDKK